LNVLIGQVIISKNQHADTFNRIDNAEVYAQYSIPSVKGYAERFSFGYKQITDITQDFFMPKQWVVPAQRFRFLTEDFDWLIYLDADTYVSKNAENILTAVPSGFGASIEKRDPKWIKKFRLERLGGYFNSGVMVMDKKSALLIYKCLTDYTSYSGSIPNPRLDIFEPFSDQSFLNYAVAYMNIPFTDLPREKWNYLVTSEQDLLTNPGFSIAHFPWKYKEILYKLYKESREL
jgi:hypothetical protein